MRADSKYFWRNYYWLISVRLLLSILCFFSILTVHAQLGISGAITLKGIITDAETGNSLPLATVINTTTQQSVFTDNDGRYETLGHIGDKITVTYMGYKPTQLVVTESNAYLPQHIELKQMTYNMKEVIITPKYTPYQADSIARYSTYKRTLLRRHEGSVMSPVTLLAEAVSHKSKQMFRFQKAFAELENERFTGTRYTPELVGQLTGLDGDTLAHFMNAYPVPYDYARASSELEFKMWVRDNYKEWVAKGRPVPNIAVDTTQLKR